MSDFNRQNTGTMGSTGTMNTGTRGWDDFRDTYRSDWENRYGRDRSWQDHETGYRYGWESAQNDRFRGREFHDSESDLQSGWDDYSKRSRQDSDRDMGEGDHNSVGGKMSHAWESFKDTVQEGWDRARMELSGDNRR